MGSDTRQAPCWALAAIPLLQSCPGPGSKARGLPYAISNIPSCLIHVSRICVQLRDTQTCTTWEGPSSPIVFHTKSPHGHVATSIMHMLLPNAQGSAAMSAAASACLFNKQPNKVHGVPKDLRRKTLSPKTPQPQQVLSILSLRHWCHLEAQQSP